MKDMVTKFDLEAAFKALDEIEIPVPEKGIRANRVDLEETFHSKSKLEQLVEDYYDVNNTEDMNKAAEERAADIAQAKLDKIEKIVDLDAKTPEDLQPSYVGKYIIQCPQCMTLFYKDKKDVEPSEEDPNVVNVGEKCQHCGNDTGYTVIGKVGEATPDDVKAETKPEENPEENAPTTEAPTENAPVENAAPAEEEKPAEENNDLDLNINLNPVNTEAPAEENKEEAKPEETPEEEKPEETKEETKESLNEDGEDTAPIDEGINKEDFNEFIDLCKKANFTTMGDVADFIAKYPNNTMDELRKITADKNECLKEDGEDIPTDGTPIEEKPEDVKVDEKPVEDPVDEVKVDEPKIDTPVEDTPIEEKPVEEIPVEEPAPTLEDTAKEIKDTAKKATEVAKEVKELAKEIKDTAKDIKEIAKEEKAEDKVEETPIEEVKEDLKESLNEKKDTKEDVCPECGKNPCECNKKEECLVEAKDITDAEVDELFNSDEFKEPISDEEVQGYLSELHEAKDITVEEAFRDTDDINEKNLQECISKSLTQVYNNVESFEITDCILNNNKFIVEGLINFKSGLKRDTRYVFTEATIKGVTLNLKGVNNSLSKNGNFLLECVNTNKVINPTQLKYEYRINESLVAGKGSLE